VRYFAFLPRRMVSLHLQSFLYNIIVINMTSDCFMQADRQGDHEQAGVFNISGEAVNDQPITSQPIGVSSAAANTRTEDAHWKQSSAIPMPYC